MHCKVCKTNGQTTEQTSTYSTRLLHLSQLSVQHCNSSCWGKKIEERGKKKICQSNSEWKLNQITIFNWWTEVPSDLVHSVNCFE